MSWDFDSVNGGAMDAALSSHLDTDVKDATWAPELVLTILVIDEADFVYFGDPSGSFRWNSDMRGLKSAMDEFDSALEHEWWRVGIISPTGGEHGNQLKPTDEEFPSRVLRVSNPRRPVSFSDYLSMYNTLTKDLHDRPALGLTVVIDKTASLIDEFGSPQFRASTAEFLAWARDQLPGGFNSVKLREFPTAFDPNPEDTAERWVLWMATGLRDWAQPS